VLEGPKSFTLTQALSYKPLNLGRIFGKKLGPRPQWVLVPLLGKNGKME